MEGGRRNDVMVALVDDGFWIGGLIREGKGWELGVGQVWGRKDDTSYVSSSDACLLACLLACVLLLFRCAFRSVWVYNTPLSSFR